MRFALSHAFDAPPEMLGQILLDPQLQETLTDIGDLHDRRVLSLNERPDGTMVREVRCVLALEVSGIARSILGDADPAWIQHETWSRDATHCEWVIHPEVGAELLTASGEIAIAGSEDGISTRSVTGEVKVRVPLYGGKVERWIVAGVTRAYDEEAARIATWLEREE